MKPLKVPQTREMEYTAVIYVNQQSFTGSGMDVYFKKIHFVMPMCNKQCKIKKKKSFI